MSSYLLLLLLIPFVACLNVYPLLLQRSHHSGRHQFKDEIRALRRFLDEDHYVELRATGKSDPLSSGRVVTLQNRAAMNTRLRVLFTDSTGNPSILETGRVLLGQSKSVTLPTNAQHVRIIVEKDMFFEHWRLAYNGTLSNGNQCLRITGVTFRSKIHPCQ